LTKVRKRAPFPISKGAIPAVFSIKMGPLYSKERVRSGAEPIAVQTGIQFFQRNMQICQARSAAAIQYTADGFRFEDEIISIPLIAFGLLHQQEIAFRPPRIHVLRATKWFASREMMIKHSAAHVHKSYWRVRSSLAKGL
jgi:hypothetical protein